MSTPTEPNHSSTAPTSDTRTDPAMRALYQMSRTAGVGLQDYASVNVASVLSIVGGLLTALLAIVFHGSQLYYFTGTATLVLAVVGFLQVVGSNGTQTGKLLAGLGALLAIGSCAFAGVRQLGIAREDNQHREKIIALLEDFGTKVKAEDFRGAYELTDERFQQNVDPSRFTQTLGDIGRGLYFRGVRFDRITSENDVIEIIRDPGTDRLSGAALMLVIMPGATTRPGSTQPTSRPEGVPDRLRVPVELTHANGTWRIHAIEDWLRTRN
jgi:hypothetical protein